MSKTDNHNKMYINAAGQRVMRITEIIKMLSKDSLTFWANMLGFQGVRVKDELERTANIGSLFHGVMEDYFTPGTIATIDYEKYKIFDYRSQVEATNAIKSFFKWYEENRSWYKVAFREKVLVGMNYGGTVDTGLEGVIDPKKVILADYKTSPNFYLTQFLQLGGYVDLYEELNGPDTVEGVIVIIADKKHGDKAQSMFIPRKNMDILITCFHTLFYMAVSTKHLENVWMTLGREVPDAKGDIE